MKIKRIISIVLAALLICTVLPVVSFASGTVTVSGEANFVSAPEGTYSKLTYTATYSNGIDADVTDPTAFTWEVTKDGAAVTDVFCVNGEFIVAGGTEGTYTLTATHTATGIKSADFNITVKAATLYDWDNNALTSSSIATEPNGNKYFKSTSGGTFTLKTAESDELTTGVKTVRFKFRRTADCSSDYLFYVRDWEDTWKVTSGSNNTYTVYRHPMAARLSKTFTNDEWYELSIVYDMTGSQKKLSAYVDGEICLNSSAYTYYSAETYRYKFCVDADDVVTFSGIEYQPELNIEDVKREIIVPQSATGKACVQLSASSIIYGTDGITWSIPETPGVSINANTGLVTVTNGADAGTVTVTATQAGRTAQTDLVLKVVSEDFESYDTDKALTSPWLNSKVASDGAGNKYISKTGDYIGYYFSNVISIAKSGSMVVELKFKGDAYVKIKRADSDWSLTDRVSLGTSSTWKNAKLVFNNTKNANDRYTVTAFVDDQMIRYNNELTAVGGLDRVLVYATSVDDFKVYGVDFAAPEAHNVTLADVAPGSELALSYRYYNEGSVAENGTEITWAYADSKDSANWTALPEYDGKLAIDAEKTAQLDGKYVKAVVTPKCVNPYTNEVVAGTPVEKIVAVSDVILSPRYTIAGEVFDIDNDTLAVGQMLSYTLAAKQIEESATTYMVVMAKYTADGKELLLADAKDLTTQKGVVKEVSVALEKEEGTMIKVYVWEKADLSPVIYNIVK